MIKRTSQSARFPRTTVQILYVSMELLFLDSIVNEYHYDDDAVSYRQFGSVLFRLGVSKKLISSCHEGKRPRNFKKPRRWREVPPSSDEAAPG